MKNWIYNLCRNRTKRMTVYLLSIFLVLFAVALLVFADFADGLGERRLMRKEEAAAKAKTKQLESIAQEHEKIVRILDANVETEEEHVKRVRKEAKKAKVPADIIEMLDKNEETVTFVENYEKDKDTQVPDDLGDSYVEGEIPQILQWDTRWGYQSYGTAHVGGAGCGPTSLAMVAAGLKKDPTITPYKVAKYSEERSMVDDNNSTYWSLMTAGAKHYGLNGRKIGISETEAKKQLKAGNPLICSMKPGDFTKTGHFIVITDWVGKGKVRVNDPFSQVNSDKLWKFSEIQGQIKAMWYFTVQ